jgi:DNA-binding MarR family transcriptional regulator
MREPWHPLAVLEDADEADRLASPERALDGVLAQLEQRNLTATEARVLLWLAEGDASPTELADALGSESAGTLAAVRRLERRGLVRRRFTAGQRAPCRLNATVAGLRTVAPLVERVAGTSESNEHSLWSGPR